ncbi:MAG: beta-galactosidase trimerization domain-containing protein [Bacteroidetes bacterium]|nr:beta-galactosidase trimerization domain-containing protein [Bacteroidota bacterium]
MYRRKFIKNSALFGGGIVLGGSVVGASEARGAAALGKAEEWPAGELWFGKSVRWAQLAFVESDPGKFDPDFWLSYFKRIHADGALLSAGGVVAFYPTDIPLHHRSDVLGNSNPLGYLVEGCRKMNMSICLRTDPHAARQNVYDAHPDWIAVTADGQKRRHWANPDLWVTCALGPYNFEFMTKVNQEIMERFKPDGIFSNRWNGSGMCYCQHCVENFRKYSGMELPRTDNRFDPVFQKYVEWRNVRLKELWFLWDAEIRKVRADSRFIPNGFPDKLLTGKNSDFFFADQQARSGYIPPWANARGAKETRATLGMKPQIGIFSVGIEEEFRWKDSVQGPAEIRIWVAEGVANGLLPCFVKFGAVLYDKRWLDTVSDMYQVYHRGEKYLRNTACLARVGLVYSEQTDRNYGSKPWQQKGRDHSNGMYHALVENRTPFEMVNDKLLDADSLKAYKLLVLPNIAALSDDQCEQLRKFVQNGGSLVATFETSLYKEDGSPRSDFGLSDIFGVSFAGKVEGPMRNSYLKLKADPASKTYHPVLKGMEGVYRIINTIYQVDVTPKGDFPSPVTLVPTYPDLPMEDVYPRVEDTATREVYCRTVGKGRVVYIPGDLDRSFWQILNIDHGKLLRNSIDWALNEEPVVSVEGPGVLDVTAWKQKSSMAVHLVNLTNPMMMKGPYREFIPVEATVSIKVPDGLKVSAVHLVMADRSISFEVKQGRVKVTVPKIIDHEIVALDLA